MTNFDFHKLLFPSEFERFCTDILEIRESNLKFTTYKSGSDGGIDIRAINTNQLIIGQCKLYAPSDYTRLKRNLRKEVENCIKNKPQRYILCFNINLSPSQADELMKMFKGFILSEEDLIDGVKLNRYLNKEEYKYLFKSYSKLLAPNFNTIELAIESIVNRKYKNKTQVFINELEKKKKLFHSTSQIPILIEKLENENVLILTGNPGVGKTTTAMIISNYFLSKKVTDIVFLEERDYSDIYSVIEENRIIIVDDFWGQNFSPKIVSHSTYQREFVNIIKSVKCQDNCFLILTSRDYVIKDILRDLESEALDIFKDNSCVIKIEDFSNEDKLRILLNHYLFHNFNLSYFLELNNSNVDTIINHKNYSPRHLDFFLKQHNTEENYYSYFFSKKLIKYLDNPKSFWKSTIDKLSPTAKTIILLLFISGDELGIDDLRLTFNKVQIKVRNLLNEDIKPNHFENELIKLEEFYIKVEDSYITKLISFQSPGIKDYLLEYLRHEGRLWLEPIIEGAIFFNQLTYIFSTKDEKIEDFSSDIVLYGKKIILDETLRRLLEIKIINDFNSLGLSNYPVYSEDFSKYSSLEEIKYYKLLTILELYSVCDNRNILIKKFIINQVSSDIISFIDNGKVLNSKNLLYFPLVIKHIINDLNFDQYVFLELHKSSIQFAMEYESFYEFKNIMQSKFNIFFKANIDSIINDIKRLVFEDIDYYLDDEEDGIGSELDFLLSYGIERLKDIYNFSFSEEEIRLMENKYDLPFTDLLNDIRSKLNFINRNSFYVEEKIDTQLTDYDSIINEYLPMEDKVDDAILFLKRNSYVSILDLIKNDSFIKEYTADQILFESICEYLVAESINLDSLEEISLLSDFYDYHCCNIQIESNIIIQISELIENSSIHMDDAISKEKLKQILKPFAKENITLEKLSPFISEKNGWYWFSSVSVKLFFEAKRILLSNFENFSEILQNKDGLLEYVYKLDPTSTSKYFILPNLERMLLSIDTTSEQRLLISFSKFFHLEFSLIWIEENESFLDKISTDFESHLEAIIRLYNIEFYLSDFDTYFIQSLHDEMTKSRLFIDSSVTPRLNAKIFSIKNSISTINSNNEILYNITLCKFLETKENFDILKDLGMVKYVQILIEKIRQVVENLKYNIS